MITTGFTWSGGVPLADNRSGRAVIWRLSYHGEATECEVKLKGIKWLAKCNATASDLANCCDEYMYKGLLKDSKYNKTKYQLVKPSRSLLKQP